MLSPYQSLTAQVAAVLRTEVRSGTWVQILPSERQLVERLAVSRKTIRKALGMLRSEGLIRTDRRRASSLITRPPVRTSPIHKVALLFPDSLDEARPFTVLWLNRLTALLNESGLQLEVFTGRRYFGTSAGNALKRLVELHPDRCWILARTHRAMQEWFVANRIPALVAGTSHAGIDLPSVDVDHRGLCRHAAIALLREGHSRLALFLDKAGRAGDDDSEQGFREGIATNSHAEEPFIRRPDGSPASVIRELNHLQQLAAPPTAYLLASSFSYLTVLSALAAQGLRVPRDISLISRDEEPFLSHLQPNPARYATSPAKYATAIYQAIKRVLEHNTAPFQLRITANFIKGGSVGRPNAASATPRP